MDIKNFIRTNRIFLAALFTMLVIIIVLLVFRQPSVTYSMSAADATAMLKDTGNQVSPLDLYAKLAKGDKSIVLIDVRSADEFTKGHIEGALNLPVRDLLSGRAIDLFNELTSSGTTAILYGEDQLEAGSPWMVLRQTGFKNLKVLMGGYAYYKQMPLPDSLRAQSELNWNVEQLHLDSTMFVKSAQPAVKAEMKTTRQEKVIPVKKPASGGGGC